MWAQPRHLNPAPFPRAARLAPAKEAQSRKALHNSSMNHAKNKKQAALARLSSLTSARPVGVSLTA